MKKFITKVVTYIRNKVYGKIFVYQVHKYAPLKIENHKEFLDGLNQSNIKQEYLLNFTAGFVLKSEQEELAAIGETCVLEDYQKYDEIKINKHDVVFDVGAHIGSFSIYAAHKGALVYAFEPDPSSFRKLLKNIDLNNLKDKVIPFNFGIYEYSGKLELNISESNNAGNSVLTDNTSNSISISVKKLQDVFAENSITKVDLLKIDVEGSEYKIFEGLNRNEASVVRKIVGEYHLLPSERGYTFEYIQKLLKPYYGKIIRYNPYYFYAVNNLS